MKSIIILGFSALAAAQIKDNGDGQFTCPQGADAFCAGGSLSSNIIIRCNGTMGQPGNCNDNLAGVPPVGVKTSALCYQSSDTAGDAACSFNGMAYYDNGTAAAIPGGSSGGGSSSSSAAAGGGSYGSQSMTMMTSYTAPAQSQASGAPATQINDGQVQAGSNPVQQINDGQVQAGSNPVQQISDGQVQATPSEQSAPAVTQINDGQVQAGTANASGPAATQINDGQVQAGSGNSSAPAQATAGAGHLAASAFSAVLIAFAVALAL